MTLEIGDTLYSNFTLNTGQSILASTDCYATLKPDGNFVLYHKVNETEIEKWDSKTNTSQAPKPFKLIMQTDGNLVLYDANDHAVWASNTQNRGKAPHRLVMQSDGNLVIYDKQYKATWASNTNSISKYKISKTKLSRFYFLAIVNDTLCANHSLTPLIPIRSTKNEFYAILQSDGNFVLYRSSKFKPSNALWNTKTYNLSAPKPFKLIMQSDGNLVLYDANDNTVWASNTQNRGKAPHRLVMQSDGNLAIYDKHNEVTWATGTKIY